MTKMRALVIAVVLVLGLGVVGSAPGSTAPPSCTQTTRPIEIGIVSASGCYVPVTVNGAAGYRFERTFRMNGWDVTPDAGAAVLFLPGDSTNRRQGVVRTVGGAATVSAVNARFGKMSFPDLRFDLAPPNQGTQVLAASALAQPAPVVFSILPLSVKQPIVLEEGGSSVELSFDLGGLLGQMVAKTEKKLGFTLSFAVSDGKFTLEGGGGSVKDFAIAQDLFVVNELTVQVDDSIVVTFEGTFKLPRNGMSIGGSLGFDRKTGVPVRVGFKFDGANVQLGTTPVYWQGLDFSFGWPPPRPAGTPLPPFTGRGTVSLSVGQKQKFFGSDVAPVAAETGMEVKTRDEIKKLPGYFALVGTMKVFGLEVGSAEFKYIFGGGAQMGVTLGISFPSGRNDPGAPNYVGGSFRGAFWSGGFNLEGSALLKVLGVRLAGAEAVVSNYGIGGCLRLGLAVGGGIRWSDGRAKGFVGWTCDLGEYRRQMPRLFPRAAQVGGGGDEFDVDLTGRDRVIKVVAADADEDAPHVVLMGEDGEQVRAPSPDDWDGLVKRKDGHAISDDSGATVFVLPPESDGSWTVRELPGSSDVGDVLVARATTDPVVDAVVTGNPRRPGRTLTWDATDRPFQTLVFSEVLPDGQEVFLKRTNAASGSAIVRPSQLPGAWGERKLKVKVLQRMSTPRAEMGLGRFRVTRPARPDTVRRVTASRRGDRVSVSWPRARGARSYDVSARVIGFPLIHHDVVTGRRAQLEVEAVAPLRVTVTPLGRLDRPGKSATARIGTRSAAQ